MKQLCLFIFLAIMISACGDTKKKETTATQGKTTAKKTESHKLAYQLRRKIEHETTAFTQGLVYHEGKLLESTGGENSWIAVHDIESGTYEKKVQLKPRFFGEGIAILNQKIYQLTWKSKLGFVYDLNTFEKIKQFAYDFEGWGITTDGHHLIISDGTDQLHYLDTLTLKPVFSKSVTYNGKKASDLNELEMIDGYIYANQWQTDLILRIDPATYRVDKVLDLSNLTKEVKNIKPDADVLNGIAYNPNTKDIFVTGKYWPLVYTLRISE